MNSVSSVTTSTVASAVALSTVFTFGAYGIDDEADLLKKAINKIEQLESKISTIETRHDAEIAAIRNENGDKWLTQQRAQEIRELVNDVLADSETRSSLQSAPLTAGWNKGFFISSADGNFTLEVSGEIQARFAFNNQPSANRVPSNDSESAEYGFEMRRVKIGFDGNILDPSWTYKIRLGWNQNFPITQTSTNFQNTLNNPVLEQAFIRKDFGNGFAVKTGQWKSNFNYEESVSSTDQQLVERTLVNQYFNTKWIQGVELEYQTEHLRANVNYNDGGGNRNLGVASLGNESGNNVEWATAGRVALKLAGEWKQFREVMSFRGSDDGMQIAAAYNWQRGGSNNVFHGDFVGNSDGVNLSYTADFNARFSGVSFFAAFLGNTFYSRPDGAAPVNSYGAVVQGGYFVSEDVELAARWEWLNVSGGTTDIATGPTPGTASAINAQHFSIYTVGANYYISKNAIKLNGDVGYVVGGILFQNGLYNQFISGADYRSDQTSDSTGQVVLRIQLQLVF
ncbi:MAG: porin [Planctomycetota bacterium]|nr:porin [Planctomycetota bacterium]MDA1263050.1 porin [Planctomycetota bacterium]